ncbi:MAG: sigma-70 family RNA polymerase sigma factor [Myxococcota bacterium]
MTVVEDTQLAQRVADDPEAAAVFGRRLSPRVRGLARHLMGARDGWEDAAQLSLIELLRAAPRYNGSGSLERWSDRITVRTTLRFARARREVQARQGDQDPEHLLAPPGADLVAQGEVLGILERLDPTRRTVVVLRHVYEYGIDEIANLTGVSRNTVKDRLVQGRREVRQHLRAQRARPALKLVRTGQGA